MNWREFEYNHKGFVHHTETPTEDKTFYIQHKEKAQRLLQIGESFIQSEGVYSHRSIPRGREELGANSKYLHRGVYCPSPVRDILITNAKRGKILVRPTERSRITNRYIYDISDKLIFVDNYIDSKMVSSEYLIYRDNVVYGVTIGIDGKLVSISEEQYSEGRIVCYICAFYSRREYQVRCYQLNCEEYHYNADSLKDSDYYQVHYGFEDVAPSGFIKHNRYRFTTEDGLLKSFTLVNNDGTPIEGSVINEIKIKRKA